jgi:glycosyltransferase involved in cell wall biosynthesis
MKVFFTCHGLDWQRKKWPKWASMLIYLGELSAIVFAQYRIVVSQELQQYFASKHGIKAFYIPNGIKPLPPRKPDQIKQQWDLSARRYFLCVGRLVPEKRMEDVIQAYLLKPRDCRLVIVGDNAAAGQYMNDLIRLAGKSSSILFTGYQFGAVLEELLSNARAFFTASELEGLPITLLEALSFGVICATSAIGPHQEVTGALPGLSFPVGDVQAISNCMDHVEAMTDEELDGFKREAVAMVSKHFSWDAVCGEHDRLYRASLDR